MSTIWCSHGGTSLGPKVLRIPEDLDGGLRLMLRTSITVFGPSALEDSVSGLTCPRILYDAGTMRGGETMEFEYRLGGEPGFRYRSL